MRLSGRRAMLCEGPLDPKISRHTKRKEDTDMARLCRVHSEVALAATTEAR